MKPDSKIILPGGAGLVGQNLIIKLKAKGYTNIIVLDKHKTNIEISKKIHPDVKFIFADLSQRGDWISHFEGAGAVVMLQAQFAGDDVMDFQKNNVNASENILDCIKKQNIPRLVAISSAVVASVAQDFYTDTKKEQEKRVLKSGIPCHVLRPTLMFGWYDRKNLGWLSRFMKKFPVFPVPGDGRYMRQPLYVGDFCQIIISCLENNISHGIYNISGRDKVDYIDIIREIKMATKSKTFITKIPYRLFYTLLWIWGRFDKKPPFTTQQLEAFTARDQFEVIDWPSLFSVQQTPFKIAIDETFNHPIYSKTVLEL